MILCVDILYFRYMTVQVDDIIPTSKDLMDRRFWEKGKREKKEKEKEEKKKDDRKKREKEERRIEEKEQRLLVQKFLSLEPKKKF